MQHSVTTQFNRKQKFTKLRGERFFNLLGNVFLETGVIFINKLFNYLLSIQVQHLVFSRLKQPSPFEVSWPGFVFEARYHTITILYNSKSLKIRWCNNYIVKSIIIKQNFAQIQNLIYLSIYIYICMVEYKNKLFYKIESNQIIDQFYNYQASLQSMPIFFFIFFSTCEMDKQHNTNSFSVIISEFLDNVLN